MDLRNGKYILSLCFASMLQDRSYRFHKYRACTHIMYYIVYKYDTACIYIAAFRDKGIFNYLFCSCTRSEGFCQTWNRIAMTASASPASVMVSALECESVNSSMFFVPHVFAVKGCCPFESQSKHRDIQVSSQCRNSSAEFPRISPSRVF